MPKNRIIGARSVLLTSLLLGTLLLTPVRARAAHPAIWLDRALLTQLRQKAAKRTIEWAELKKGLDAHLSENLRAGYQGSDWYDRVMAYALAYQVLKGANPAAAKTYAAKALVYAKALSRDNVRSGTVGDGGGGDATIRVDSGWVARTAGIGLAIAYDWLYDYPGFDAATKTEFRNRLNAWIRWYERDGYARDNYTSNYFMGYFSMKAYAGYALEDTALTASANELWDAHVVPGFNKDLVGGDWIVSNWNYGPGVVQKVAGYLLARKTATGVDSVAQFPWIEQHLDYKIHALHPGGKSVYVDGPWSGSDSGYVTNRDMIYVHQVLKGKPVAQYIQWYILHDTETRGHGATDWEKFLFFDPKDPKADYKKTKPLQYRAGDGVNGYGFVGMRSSWSDDATWVGFRAGGKGLGETDDANQGHFEIFKNDLLAVNAGMWQRDGLETFRQGESDYRNILKIVDTDGCQQYHNMEKSQAYTGHAEVTQVKYEGAADVVYIDADLRGAYKANTGCYPLQYYHRQFFYLRPDYVVVLDRLTTRAADYTKAFLLHWPGKPLVDGRTASGTYPLNKPTGKLQFASLSPANVRISTSPDLAGHLDRLTRMTVAAGNANASEIFLNAMRATTPSDRSAFSPTLVTAEDRKMVGLRIVGSARDYYVVFGGGADSTPVQGTVSYPREPGVASEHYWVDLPPNTAFDVTSTERAITITPGKGSLSSSAQGILRYSTTGRLREGSVRSAKSATVAAADGAGRNTDTPTTRSAASANDAGVLARTRPRRGCGCSVPGTGSRDALGLTFVLAGLLLARTRVRVRWRPISETGPSKQPVSRL
ncbi:MAG: hypothetical protein JW940_31905 [Polyangiaceae bacterium]|nr:hypothetical protein [Polyangiaceae bacterium]